MALGVPRPLVLGFVCSLFAIFPVVGTPLVWLPVAGGLFIVGATFKTVILLVIGGALGLGPGGLILGPLIFRLAKEAVDAFREDASAPAATRE